MAASVEDVLQRVYTENLRGVKLKKEQEKAVLTQLLRRKMFSQFCRRYLVKASFTKAIVLQKMLSIV